MTENDEILEVVQAVEDLNAKYVYSTYTNSSRLGEMGMLENTGACFDFMSNGCITLINFADINLWNSDDDMREWDEHGDDYIESIEEFVEKEYIRLVNELYRGLNGTSDTTS